ncbi:ABC-type transport system substrate-binding protein [Enemella evansiae]|nr:ABC-type transport system substrate-binding protein [Enemella evansiae]
MTTCPRCGAVKPAGVDVCIWCAAELGRNVRPGSAYAEGFSYSGPGLGPRWYPDGSTGPGVRPAGPNGEPPLPPPAPGRSSGPAPGRSGGTPPPPGRTGRTAWPWVLAAVLAVVVTLAVLFAFGVLRLPPRADPGPAPAPTAPTAPAGTPTPVADTAGADINPADPASLREGSTLRLAGVPMPADTLDPFDPEGYVVPSTRDFDLVRATFPVFVRFDPRGRPSWDPAYVTGAEVLSTEPTRIRLTLNPAAVWGDGTPLQAADVAAVWRRCSSADRCGVSHVWSGVADVRQGADPQIVEVDYRAADGEWQRPFAYVSAMPEAAMAADADWSKPAEAWQAGPYRVQEAALSGSRRNVTLVANDRWWGTPPRSTRILVTSDDDAGEVMATGRADVALFDSASGYQTARRGGGETRLAPSSVRRQLLQNPRIEPSVRRAVQLALDRPALTRMATSGLPEPVPLDNTVLLTNQPGYLAQSPARDLDAARRMLDEAGWVSQDNSIRRRGTDQLRLTMITTDSRAPFSAEMPVELRKQLLEIGIDVRVERIPFAETTKRLQTGDYDLFAHGWFDDQFPAATAQGLYGSTGYDKTAVADPSVATLLDRARATPDEATRAQLLNEADVLLQRDASIVPLYQEQQIVIAKPAVANYGAFGLGSVDWVRVGLRS